MKMTITCACNERFGAWREHCPACGAAAPPLPEAPVTPRWRGPFAYELDVLSTTVFHTKTKADTKRAAVQYAYDRLLAERVMNVSTTMAPSERGAA